MLTVADVAALIGAMHEGGLARESIRKTRATLAMVLDFAGVQPNPARDRSVKLPPKDRTEIAPPTATHVEAILAAVPRPFRGSTGYRCSSWTAPGCVSANSRL